MLGNLDVEQYNNFYKYRKKLQKKKKETKFYA